AGGSAGVPAWLRRVDPVGALSLVAFGVAALALWLSGGNPLMVKLQDAIVTGPVGVALIVSTLAGYAPLDVIRRLSSTTTRPADAGPSGAPTPSGVRERSGAAGQAGVP